ncbi:MAG: hypothetical protein ACRDLM_10885 [Gaiellaceae bacterium]
MIDMENLVREVMTEQTEDLYLGHDAANRALRAAAKRRFGRRRVVLIAAVGAACTVVGAGVAAATGVLPWWNSVHAIESSPFGKSADPAAVAGSTVRLSVPGPASTTFEVVTNTVTVGTDQENCTAIAVKNAQGRSQHLMTNCGAPGAAIAQAGSFDWQAPSGVTYAIIAGPTPTSTAAKVALLATNGLTVTAEPVAGGYYLVYAPAELSTGNLVFYDARGQVVDELALHPNP